MWCWTRRRSVRLSTPLSLRNSADKTIFVVQWASTPRELVDDLITASVRLINASLASYSIPSI